MCQKKTKNTLLHKYYWSISTATEDWEVLSLVDDCHDFDNNGYDNFKGFSTPQAAFSDGLKQLKTYKEGCFMLEVYSIAEIKNAITASYEEAYKALISNNLIQKV